MVTKQELRNYQSLSREIQDLEAELRAMTDSRTAKLSHTRGGTNLVGGLEIPVSQIMDLEKLIRAKSDVLTAERLRIERALECLAARERELIRLRYFYGYNWIRIQFRFERSERWIHALHSAALKKLLACAD